MRLLRTNWVAGRSWLQHVVLVGCWGFVGAGQQTHMNLVASLCWVRACMFKVNELIVLVYSRLVFCLLGFESSHAVRRVDLTRDLWTIVAFTSRNHSSVRWPSPFFLQNRNSLRVGMQGAFGRFTPSCGWLFSLYRGIIVSFFSFLVSYASLFYWHRLCVGYAVLCMV